MKVFWFFFFKKEPLERLTEITSKQALLFGKKKQKLSFS